MQFKQIQTYRVLFGLSNQGVKALKTNVLH